MRTVFHGLKRIVDALPAAAFVTRGLSPKILLDNYNDEHHSSSIMTTIIKNNQASGVTRKAARSYE